MGKMNDKDIFDGVSDVSAETLMELRKMASSNDLITAEVLTKLRDGDHESYQKVYMHARKPIRKFVLNIVGSEAYADDITQDIFFILWEYKEKIEPEKNIRTFLFFIARRILNKYRRSQQIHERYANSVWFEESDNFTSHDFVVEKEAELLKRSILRRMPAQQRRIFEMSHDEGLSPEEIAERLGVKRDTVYTKLSKARKEIRDAVLLFLVVFAAHLSDDSIRTILRSIIK